MKKVFKKFLPVFFGFIFVSLFCRGNVFGLSEAENQSEKVSIIVPVYNMEKYLDECLKSVENQTYKNLEIICVNDGSTDGSLKVFENHAEKDDRIVIINQENQGVSEARNNGIKAATGKYVYFLDSDDILFPHVMEKSVNFLEKHDADALEVKFIRWRDNQKFDFSKTRYDDSLIRVSTYKEGENPFKIFSGTIKVWARVYKKSFLTENDRWFDKNIRISEDVLFNFMSRFYMKKLIRDDNVGYLYRIDRPGSAVTENPGNERFHIENNLMVIRAMISFRNKLSNMMGFESNDVDEYFASYMIELVYGRWVNIKNVKNPNDKRELAIAANKELEENFIKKYNVDLKTSDKKRLDELKKLAE